uniref:C-type lectin domain-containing protein n=1 Tax=Oreochromis niloticus TaxID=8128 RepID=A0A669F0Z1_ORENI
MAGNVLPHMLTFLLCCVLSIFSAHSQCQSGWREYENKCYFFSTDTKSWFEANEFCLEGGNLASIHTQEEEEFLALYSKGTTKWIGYSWSDGTPLSHTNWGDGEPNNHEGREDCVEMVSNANGTYSLWNDLNCDAHQDWICKITKGKDPILPPEPPSPEPGN